MAKSVERLALKPCCLVSVRFRPIKKQYTLW